MLFSKLLPREGNFFELFDQHAGFIAEGARAFIRLIQNYNDLGLREKHAIEVDAAERAGRQGHRRGEPPAAQDVHHAARPRRDPQAHHRDGRHPRPDGGRRRPLLLYDVQALTEAIQLLRDICAQCCERVQ